MFVFGWICYLSLWLVFLLRGWVVCLFVVGCWFWVGVVFYECVVWLVHFSDCFRCYYEGLVDGWVVV